MTERYELSARYATACNSLTLAVLSGTPEDAALRMADLKEVADEVIAADIPLHLASWRGYAGKHWPYAPVTELSVGDHMCVKDYPYEITAARTLSDGRVRVESTSLSDGLRRVAILLPDTLVAFARN